MSGDWLNKGHENLEIIFNICWELRSLAESFKNVGNIIMFERLIAIAEDLEISHKAIRDSLGESLSESTRNAEKMTKTVVEAALAGCIISKPETKK